MTERDGLEEWQKHIRHPSVDKPDEAVCGAKLTSFDWVFTDIDHAYCSAAGGFRLLPCPACAAEVIRAFTEAIQ